jgi:hypothetical protein
LPSISDILSYLLSAVLIFFGLIFLIASTIEPMRVLPGIALLGLGGLIIYLRHMLKPKPLRRG